MDISLADPSSAVRRQSREAVLKTLDRAMPLNPSSHTLHLTFQGVDHHPDTIKAWQESAIGSLIRLLKSAPFSPRSLCVETLDFPPPWLAPVVNQLDLSICVDVGHIIRFGFDLQESLELFSQRIGIFHLHGVSGTQDHRSLEYLHSDTRRLLAGWLRAFRGSVSLEVFSYPELAESMVCFRDMMARI